MRLLGVCTIVGSLPCFGLDRFQSCIVSDGLVARASTGFMQVVLRVLKVASLCLVYDMMG